MSELLSKLQGGELIGLVAATGGLLVAAIAVVAIQWRRVRIAEMESALKQQMIDKGMSPVEIEQVLKATQGSEGTPPVAATGNEAVDKAALAQKMVENGYEAGDIAKVLNAYQYSAYPADEPRFTK